MSGDRYGMVHREELQQPSSISVSTSNCGAMIQRIHNTAKCLTQITGCRLISRTSSLHAFVLLSGNINSITLKWPYAFAFRKGPRDLPSSKEPSYCQDAWSTPLELVIVSRSLGHADAEKASLSRGYSVTKDHHDN